MTQAPAIPDHVPPELVRSVGITYAPDYLADPYDFLASLHDKQPPIFFNTTPHSRGSWLVTGYTNVFYVLRNPELFVTGLIESFPRKPDAFFNLLPIEIDPPDHRKYRAILDPMLSMRSVADQEPAIRKLANDLIDSFIDKGECEFGKEFGRPLPVSVFLQLLGLPQEMRDTFVEWAMGMLHSQDRAIAGRCMQETVAYLEKVIEEKKRKPDEGAISAIVHGLADGVPLTGGEIFGFTFFLFIAGLDTVFATLNNMFLWLADHPEGRREINAHPENIDAQVEELLRIYGTTFSGRVLTKDIELGGIKMKKDDKVTCILPAANYDPATFENPREVNFGRKRKPNLSFTAGPHSCMGAHLARLEMKIGLAEFLRRIPDFKIKEGTKIEYWPGGVIGPKLVPLVW
jgi:cytochrome P450